MSQEQKTGFTALIFGASGITGWALARELLTYPTSSTFSSVIALTNRPLNREAALLPADPRLQLYSGIDLTSSVAEVVKGLKTIKGIESVTHIYFSAYTGHGPDFVERKRVNTEIVRNAVSTTEEVTPGLKFVTLQAGGKTYGLEFANQLGDKAFKTPFHESLPRVPQPFGDHVFYYAQYDALKELSAGKAWTFAEIRPDAIVGFVPNNNAMNIAQSLALFLSLYRDINGLGATISYPGSAASYNALHTDSSQDKVARFTASVSLAPAEKVREEAYNVVTALSREGPQEGALTGAEWVYAQKAHWASFVEKNSLKSGIMEGTNFDFITFLIGGVVTDRQFVLEKARGLGFTEGYEEETDAVEETVEGYKVAFDRMKKAMLILN